MTHKVKFIHSDKICMNDEAAPPFTIYILPGPPGPGGEHKLLIKEDTKSDQ